MYRNLLLTLLFSLSACARRGAPVLPPDALPVPLVRQSSGYTCGTAALQAVLYYWQVYDGNESGLTRPAGTTQAEGTPPEGIIKGAKKFGLAAYYKEMTPAAELRAALDRGEPVILDIQAWPDNPGEMPWAERREDGHYVVLVALDREYAYFMDPSVGTGYTYIPLGELPGRWHDYENTKAGPVDNKQLAIFISGKKHLKKYPALPAPTL